MNLKKESYASIYHLNLKILSCFYWGGMNRRPVNFAGFFCDDANIHWLTKEASDKHSGEEYQRHLSKILHLAKVFPLSVKHQVLGTGSSPNRTL